MKHPVQSSLFLAGALAVLPITGLFAQTAALDATPSVSAPAAAPAAAGQGEGRKERMKDAMASLTPAERHELKEAREKAKNDPAVVATKGDHKAHRRAMYEAMIKADPNVKPILEKLRTDMRDEKES